VLKTNNWAATPGTQSWDLLPGDRCVVKSFDMTKKTQKEKRENKKNIFSTISSWWMADGWDLHPSDSYNQQIKKWRNPGRMWIATMTAVPAAGFPSDPFYGTSVIDIKFVIRDFPFFVLNCQRSENGKSFSGLSCNRRACRRLFPLIRPIWKSPKKKAERLGVKRKRNTSGIE
jgi:hypothetical protein